MAKQAAVDAWLKAKSPQQLQIYKRDIIACSAGCDVNYESIYEDLRIPDEIQSDDFDPLPMWFEHCINSWTKIFNSGEAEIYRAISVQCRTEFCRNIKKTSEFGRHWTWDIQCADTCYHCECPFPDELLLKAKVKISQVDWPTTLQQNFAHGHEREISVEGIVDILEVRCLITGQVFWEKS